MLLYTIVIYLYGQAIKVMSLRNEKAKQWVNGRKNWRKTLSERTQKLGSEKRIWMHCASYGEFEQGRPVIEAIRKQHPQLKIVLSFFSPSGYEAFKGWSGVDLVCYLPLDSKSNAKDFLELINPSAAIFIKYEFWLNYLFLLQQSKTPNFLVSAVFKPHHPFFRWYGTIFRRSLRTFTKIFVQDDNSGRLLQTIGVTNYQVSGDTRFDRVVEIKKKFIPLPVFETFCKNAKIIIGGSTWPKDDGLLLETFMNLTIPNKKLILVPHEVDSKSVLDLENCLKKYTLDYSLYTDSEPKPDAKVLVVNAMGLLSRIYHYADVAYIGGGFNSGIHNCLEPAVYLKPVIFYGANDFSKFNEAVDMVNSKTAFAIQNAKEFEQVLNALLNDEGRAEEITKKLSEYFEKNSGTTEKVMHLINAHLS